MELAAVIIAGLSMVVSAITSIFAYRQATAARKQAKAAVEQTGITQKALEIEIRRRIDETTPKLDATISFVADSGHRLTLSLKSPQAVVITGVRFVDQCEVQFIGSDGTGGDAGGLLGRISPGGSSFAWVTVRHPYPRSAGLEVTCAGDAKDEKWTLLLDISVFAELDKRSPEFDVNFEFNYPPPHYLRVELVSREALASLKAKIADGQGVSFRDHDEPIRRRTAERWSALNRGYTARWPVEIDAEHSEEIALELSAVGQDGEHWTVVEEVEVPWALTHSGEPSFAYRIDRAHAGSNDEFRLDLKLESQWPLASLEIEIDDREVWFGADDGKKSKRTRRADLIKPGSTVSFRVVPDRLGLFFWLKIRAVDTDGEEWLFDHQTVNVPARLRTDTQEWLRKRGPHIP